MNNNIISRKEKSFFFQFKLSIFLSLGDVWVWCGWIVNYVCLNVVLNQHWYSKSFFHFFVVLPVVFGSSLGVSHKDIPESFR